MKTMCHPGYHHIDFVETHPSGHLMYGYAHLASVRFEHSVCPGSLMDILLISTMTRQRPLFTQENLFFSVVQMCG